MGHVSKIRGQLMHVMGRGAKPKEVTQEYNCEMGIWRGVCTIFY